jgi:hypothetical protein
MAAMATVKNAAIVLLRVLMDASDSSLLAPPLRERPNGLPCLER